MASMVKRASKSRLGWLVALGGAAVAAVAAAVFFGEKSASAAPAAPQNLLSPITDKATVTYYQNGIAQGLAKNTANDIPGLTASSYGPTDVDGNPANARWMAALSILQAFINAQRPWWKNTTAPAGFPAALRTDGVLDYATAIMLENS